METPPTCPDPDAASDPGALAAATRDALGRFATLFDELAALDRAGVVPTRAEAMALGLRMRRLHGDCCALLRLVGAPALPAPYPLSPGRLARGPRRRVYR